MKKILLAICFVSAVLASCSKVGPTSLSAIPSELHWDSDETKAQKVTVSSNYVWYAYLDDEVNWILSISSDGRTFTVAPRTENKTVDTLYAKIAVVSRELMQFVVCTQDGGPFDDHPYVDLALPSGVLWATYNVGARKPEEVGGYYGWGMTKPYGASDSVDWKLYFSSIGGTGKSLVDCGTSADPLKDYLRDGFGGTQWDVARLEWKGDWRMPTFEELTELFSEGNCYVDWTTSNGVNGTLVTSKRNGNSIFLPAAGYRSGTYTLDNDTAGSYWSTTPYTDAAHAYYSSCTSKGVDPGAGFRYRGHPIRPVMKK